MKQITDPPRWRIVCEDGTGRGMRVFAPGGEEVTQQVRAVRWEVGPHPQVVAICTLELLAVEADVKAEGAKITRYAYCKEHGDMVPVDEQNRHAETLEESVERVFAPVLPPPYGSVEQNAAALQQNTAALRDTHRCDGCRQYLPCEAVTGRGWRCEGCRG